MTSIGNSPINSMNKMMVKVTDKMASAQSSRLMSEIKPQLDAAKDSFRERMGDLKQQLKSETDPQRKLMLQNEISTVQKSFDDLVSRTEELGKRDLLKPFDEVKGMAAAGIQDFRSELIESYDRIGFEDVKLTRVFACGVSADADVGGPEKTKDTSGASGAEGSKVESSSSKSTEDVHHFHDMTPDELVTLMESDQKAFYAELKGMPVEERQLVMQQVQNQLQQINQMFSMLSQMSQAMHDTAKAVISNLRV